MKIPGMGPAELVVILVVVLIIFGPKNLPKLGSAVGKTVKNLREGMGTDDKASDEEVELEAIEETTSEEKPKKKVVKKVVKKKADAAEEVVEE